MQYVIHIVEDEVNLNQILKVYLEKEGYQVRAFATGGEAEKAIQAGVHLWIVDIMLPDSNGYTLLRKIAERTPEALVIFMSARNKEIDRVIGLEMGCDDYISKPFLPQELILRVRKLLQGKWRESYSQAQMIAGYKICRDQRKVYEESREIELSTKEFELLFFFIQHHDKAFSREQILEQVWGKSYFGSDRVVDDTIRRIRKKMPNIDIDTIYGYGYRFKREAER